MVATNCGYLSGVSTGFVEGRLGHVVPVNHEVGEVGIKLWLRYDCGDGCMPVCGDVYWLLVVGFALDVSGLVYWA